MRPRTWAFAIVLFAAALPPSFAQIQGNQPDAIEVPFEFVHGSVVVEAMVNGRGPYRMLLDSGANPSVADVGWAKDVGLTLAVTGTQGSGGGTDRNPAYETVLPTVQLGVLTATNVAALGVDLSKISLALGFPVSGVLGFSLLDKRIVQIDYPARKVRFFRVAPSCTPTAGSAVRTCITLPFRYEDDIVATGIRLNGRPVKTNFDSGSNAAFQLTPAAVGQLHLGGDVQRSYTSSSVGFNGKLSNRMGTVRNIQVGAISVTKPSVVFFGKGMGMDQEPWDLRIGNAFLKDFAVTFDFQHDQITLAAPVESPPVRHVP